ncbi:hypothetical protein HHI36_004170, partial [Cryptolaemus montrouzieri]
RSAQPRATLAGKRNQSSQREADNDKSSISILNVNIQSLQGKVHDLNLSLKNHQPDIVCIKEHCIVERSKPILDKLHIDSYILVDIFNRSTKQHGGSLILNSKADITKFIQKIDESLTVITDCKQYRNYEIAVAGDFDVDILENTRKQIRNTLDAIDTIFKVTRSNGAYIAYKKSKEILRQKIEFRKKQHHLGLVQESDNKIKTVWNIIKKEVAKPVNATNTNLSADELNDFFANVGEKVNTSLDTQTSDKAMQLLEKSLLKIDLTFTLHPTSAFE